MNNPLPLILGFISAIVMPAASVFFLELARGVGAISFWVAFGALMVASWHVLLIGVPIYFLLRRFRLLRWWSLALAGFVAGTIPTAIKSWPVEYSQYKSSETYWDGEKDVTSRVNGVPTFHGWLNYAELVTTMGFFGFVGGYMIWIGWRFSDDSLRSTGNASHPPE